MRTIALPLLLALAGLSACTTITPEGRVRAALIDAGLKPRLAGCMAERMAAKLSIAQLQRLKAMAKVDGPKVHDMTVGEILHRLRALGDPEIVSVTTRAAIGCEIAG